MALSDIVRSGVATAKTITASLQVSVSHQAWIGRDAFGAPIFDPAGAAARPALVESKQAMRRMANGQEVMQRATVTFIGPVTANGAVDRQEPIDPRDKITLPDGSTGSILSIEGVADPSTSYPYMFVVALG